MYGIHVLNVKKLWDILNDIDYDKCMNCGTPINQEDNEYYMDPAGDWRR